ncbi:hypothetical protein D3C86_2138720 [compost metagenome]
MPTQFQCAALEVLPRQRTQCPSNRDRAGERHLADDLGTNQVIGHFGRHAKHQVQDTVRHAGILKRTAQLDAG